MLLLSQGFTIQKFYLDEDYALNVDFVDLNGELVTAYWYSFGEQWLLAREGEEGVRVRDFFDQNYLDLDSTDFEKSLRNLFDHIRHSLRTELTPVFGTISAHEIAKTL